MRSTLTCLVTLMLALSAPAWADVSRDQAAQMAVQSNGGRVLSIERSQHDGQPAWRIKLLTPQGEVRVIWIAVADGR